MFLPLCCPGGLALLGPSITKPGVPGTGKVGRLRPEPWLQSPGLTLARTSSKLKWVSSVVGPQRKAKHGGLVLSVVAVFHQVPVNLHLDHHRSAGNRVSSFQLWSQRFHQPIDTERWHCLPALVPTDTLLKACCPFIDTEFMAGARRLLAEQSLANTCISPSGCRSLLALRDSDSTVLGPFSAAKPATESVKTPKARLWTTRSPADSVSAETRRQGGLSGSPGGMRASGDSNVL